MCVQTSKSQLNAHSRSVAYFPVSLTSVVNNGVHNSRNIFILRTQISRKPYFVISNVYHRNLKKLIRKQGVFYVQLLMLLSLLDLESEQDRDATLI